MPCDSIIFLCVPGPFHHLLIYAKDVYLILPILPFFVEPTYYFKLLYLNQQMLVKHFFRENSFSLMSVTINDVMLFTITAENLFDSPILLN